MKKDRTEYYREYEKRRKVTPKRISDKSEREKKRRKHDKLIALQHYSGETPRCACQNCPEHDNPHYEFLSIDHIAGGGEAHRAEAKCGGSVIYRWLRNNNWPEGYQVLCMNCNFAKRNGEICPHLSKEENHG